MTNLNETIKTIKHEVNAYGKYYLQSEGIEISIVFDAIENIYIVSDGYDSETITDINDAIDVAVDMLEYFGI